VASLVVSVPPHFDGAAWKMTVDGVELTTEVLRSDVKAA
jgi:hypothetical protein